MTNFERMKEAAQEEMQELIVDLMIGLSERMCMMFQSRKRLETEIADWLEGD